MPSIIQSFLQPKIECFRYMCTPSRRECTCNAARGDIIVSHCQYALLCATHSASVFAPYNSGFSRKNCEKNFEFQVGLYK